jgi:hypothetical protein
MSLLLDPKFFKVLVATTGKYSQVTGDKTSQGSNIAGYGSQSYIADVGDDFSLPDSIDPSLPSVLQQKLKTKKLGVAPPKEEISQDEIRRRLSLPPLYS